MDAQLPQTITSRAARMRHGLQQARFVAQMVRDPLGTIDGRFARYGATYRSPSSATPLVVTKAPEGIRDILVTHAGAFGKGHSSFNLLRTVLGDALLTSEGENWRRQRRLVQPAFARARLEAYAEVMANEAQAAALRLADKEPSKVDFSREMTRLTLRIVARTLFGYDVDESPRVARAMRWLNAHFARPDLFPAGLPTPSRLRMAKASRDLEDVVGHVIAERRGRIAAGTPPGEDLLQHLLDARDDDDAGLSDREIRDQLLTLYLAGHDTTSHALAWTFYLLAENPAALAPVQEEVDAVLGGRPPTYDDLVHLKWTEAAFKEAMRLYPPVIALPRKAVADTTVDGHAVPAGGEAILWIYHVHRDGRFFDQPASYLPQRFLQEPAQHPKHAYLPFGLGQRACIGQQFAMIEAQLIIASFVQQLRFGYRGRRHPGLRMGVTLAPKHGVPVAVKRRSR